MRVAIIGGSGNMGRWLAGYLREEGKEVIITGRNERKLIEAGKEVGVDIATNVEAAGRADVILISVPVDNFEAVVEELSSCIHPGQVVIDVTSVKVSPVQVMHRHIKTGVVLGVHPMFGPGARGIAGQNFVLTPTNSKERALARKVREYLAARGARATLMTPEEHDEMVAIVLGLAHFIALVSADTLLKLDKLALSRAVSGTTYKVLLALVESVISEDPGLYAALQMGLPNMPQIEKMFQESSKTWAELVQGRDRQEFISRMKILREGFERDNPDFGQAYGMVYRLAAGL